MAITHHSSPESFDQTKYLPHLDLKKLIREAGLTIRDIAVVCSIAPFTLANRLNGYAPLPADLESKIAALCKRQIDKMKEEENEKKKLSAAAHKCTYSQSVKEAKAELVRKKEEAAQAAAYLAALESGNAQGEECA
jgi:hypothetical protein